MATDGRQSVIDASKQAAGAGTVELRPVEEALAERDNGVSREQKQYGGKPASWVIRNKETGETIRETSQKSVADKVNTDKYEAVPIMQYLQEMNDPNSKVRQFASTANSNVAEESTAVAEESTANPELNMLKARKKAKTTGTLLVKTKKVGRKTKQEVTANEAYVNNDIDDDIQALDELDSDSISQSVIEVTNDTREQEADFTPSASRPSETENIEQGRSDRNIDGSNGDETGARTAIAIKQKAASSLQRLGSNCLGSCKKRAATNENYSLIPI